jgi:hypothetical protein
MGTAIQRNAMLFQLGYQQRRRCAFKTAVSPPIPVTPTCLTLPAEGANRGTGNFERLGSLVSHHNALQILLRNPLLDSRNEGWSRGYSGNLWRDGRAWSARLPRRFGAT